MIRSRCFALPLPWLALLALAGCGKTTEVSGPLGDNRGEHLVAFATDRGRAAGDLAIRLYDLDQGGYRSLAGLDGDGVEAEPCISNDGNFLAFASARSGGSGGGDLYLYDRLNQRVLHPAGLNSAGDERWPRFTYDSVKLAFVRTLATGEKRVRLYEPTGDTLVPLPGLDAGAVADDDMPAPDVNGGRIAFVTNRAGNNDVRVWTRATGLLLFTVLASPADDTEPSMSADGAWVAWASDRPGGEGGYDVYLYNTVDDSLISVAGLNSAGDERHPSVSADGDVIVFQSNRAGGGGQYDLYRYVRSTRHIDQPAAFRDASQDIQPYLRWR